MSEIIVLHMNDEEQKAFVEIVIKIFNEVCKFADEFNYDRDNILAYLVNHLATCSEIATIRGFQTEGVK